MRQDSGRKLDKVAFLSPERVGLCLPPEPLHRLRGPLETMHFHAALHVAQVAPPDLDKDVLLELLPLATVQDAGDAAGVEPVLVEIQPIERLGQIPLVKAL